MCAYVHYICMYIYTHVCVYDTRLLNNGTLKSQIYFEEPLCQNVFSHGSTDASTH